MMDEDDDCMCDWSAHCNGDGMLSCDGCGGDQCFCICGGECECPGCANCEGRDEDFEEDDAQECIGHGCLNPHFIHVRSECFTVEDCEAMEQGKDDA